MNCRVLVLALSACVSARGESLRVVDGRRLEQRLRRAEEALTTLGERLATQGLTPHDAQYLKDARQEVGAARGQLQSAPAVDAWVAEHKTAKAQPDAGVEPARRADAPSTSVGVERRAVATPMPVPKDNREPVGEVEFNTLVQAMRGQDFRGGKIRVLAQGAPGRAFDVAQVIELLEEFREPEDRLEAIRLTVQGLLDPDSAPILYRACRNETERSEVRAALGIQSD